MNICGKKIVLRAIEPEDNDMLLQMLNDPETEKNLGGYSYPTSKAGQQRWLDNLNLADNTIRCVVADKEVANKGVGMVILSDINRKDGTAQIHIKLAQEGRGKGYGTDAICTMITYAFAEQRLNCVYAEVLVYNETSRHLFQKCGFCQEGIMRQRVYKNGNYVDVLNFSILYSEWLENSGGIDIH